MEENMLLCHITANKYHIERKLSIYFIMWRWRVSVLIPLSVSCTDYVHVML